MKNSQEWLDQFDVLYNNITSNQAPGLDVYEKSVFLTKAQEQIIKSYFNPKENKVGEGFDDSEKRQIDFSMLMRTKSIDIIKSSDKSSIYDSKFKAILDYHNNSASINIDEVTTTTHKITTTEPLYKANSDGSYTKIYDANKEINIVDSKEPILLIINEFVDINRLNNTVRSVVVPIKYDEYAKQMTKPNKRPPQYQTWRLIVDNDRCFDLIPALNTDVLQKYIIRYIKKPNPIILSDLDSGLSINGLSKTTLCELDESIHEEILQRAVELAKATWQGDVNTVIQVGNASGTDKGYISQQQNR